MTVRTDLGEPIVRANQVYRTYLDTIYEIDYYQKKHSRLAARSKHMDFLIGIGAAASGGSGLGILAAPEFAWACAPLTTFSTIGAIAKGSYDWAGRLQTYVEIIQHISPIHYGFKMLTEDIGALKNWNYDFQSRFDRLRNEFAQRPIDTSKDLPIDIRKQIQDEIKHRLNYKAWWEWVG